MLQLGPGAASLVDGDGHPIRPADLTCGSYKGGRGPAVVFRAISTGLPGTPMFAFGFLAPQQRWDLAHYVDSIGRGGLLCYLR